MSEKTPIRQFEVDARPLPLEARLVLSQQFLTSGMVATPLPGSAEGLNGYTKFWMLDRLVAARNLYLVARTKRAAVTQDEVTLRIRLVTRGAIDAIVDGTAVSLREGDVFLHTGEVSFAADIADADIDVFGVSATTVGFDPLSHPRFAVTKADEAPAALLRALFIGFFEGIDKADNEQASLMGDVVIAGLTAFMSNLARKQGHKPAQNRAAEMARFIETSLESPTLGLDALQQAVPASRAVIYRAFAHEGGLQRYITKRRMARGLSLLALSPLDLPVGEIARQVGYTDQRQFSRAFRREFGVSPSESRSSFAAEAERIFDDPAGQAVSLRAMLERSNGL